MANLREACKEHGLMNVAALCARFPDLDPPLAYFRTAFDREIAEREGKCDLIDMTFYLHYDE
jgi:hypothetical protein